MDGGGEFTATFYLNLIRILLMKVSRRLDQRGSACKGKEGRKEGRKEGMAGADLGD